jgi:hypothetical protein
MKTNIKSFQLTFACYLKWLVDKKSKPEIFSEKDLLIIACDEFMSKPIDNLIDFLKVII